MNELDNKELLELYKIVKEYIKKLEDSKEDTLKAQEALKAAQDRLTAAKLALEAAEKECESHMAKDVTVSINFRTQDGELANVVHTEIYIDGKYTENGAFGLPATLVNTDTVIRINFIAQTGGLDEYTLASAGDENSPEGYFLKNISKEELLQKIDEFFTINKG